MTQFTLNDSLRRCLSYALLLFLTVFPLVNLQAQPTHPQSLQDALKQLNDYRPPIISTEREMNIDELSTELREKRVVFVGEQHDRYDHHLNQLLVLRMLHQQDPELAIGVEWFQQSFQPIIDDYLSGVLDETSMLKQSGYYERWRYDYRLLRPIMEYAKQHQLPVIALNTPTEITTKISAEGLDALTTEERSQIPPSIKPPQKAYRQYLKQVFDEHMGGQGDFDTFVLIQRVWDETMAANIVQHFTDNPQQRMIVLTGSGHSGRDRAIPADVARTIPAQQIATLHSVEKEDIQPGAFDYFIISEEKQLSPTGKLGVWLEDHKEPENSVSIRKLADDSAAGKSRDVSKRPLYRCRRAKHFLNS